MFRIPNFYEMNFTFEEAVNIIKHAGGAAGDLLKGMEYMNDVWERHATGNTPFTDDDEWFEHFQYEANAYNVVFEDMDNFFGEV